jgi:hypothetical protein
MRISHEIGIRVPVTGQRTATGLFGRILRDLTLSADIFTKLITNLIVGPAVVGGAGKRNVISRLGVKIQARVADDTGDASNRTPLGPEPCGRQEESETG